MKFLSVRNLGQVIIKVMYRFFFEVLFAVVGTLAALEWNSQRYTENNYTNWLIRVLMTANLGLMASLSATLYLESKPIAGSQKILIKSAVAVAAAMFVFILNPIDRSYDTLRFFLLSLAFHLAVAFAGFTKKGQIQGFWQFNKTIFIRFLAGALYSVVLYLGLLAAIQSTKYLFGVDWDSDIYMKLWIVIAGIFNTLFFLAGIPVDIRLLENDFSYPKGLKIFTQYVLIPLATIYVLILLAYEAKILFQWRLPKGMVSNLILGYAVFGILAILLIYPVREHAANKWMNTYSRSFYFLLVPLIVLLFLATGARVMPYGFTPERYFLFLLGCWLLMITLYFLISKKQNIKFIPISLCIATLLSIYGPQSALSTSLYSQKTILIDIFKKYGAYKDGKLQPLKNVKINSTDGDNAVAKLDYLISPVGIETLQPFLYKNLQAVKDSLLKKQTVNGNGSFYRTYTIYQDELDWAKNYLGLKRYPGNGKYERLVNDTSYSVSTSEPGILRVMDYDYVIPQDDIDRPSDTIIYHSDKIRFIKFTKNDVYTLSANGESATFNVRIIADSLFGSSQKRYTYKEQPDEYNRTGKIYNVPAPVMTVTKETPNFRVTLQMERLRFDFLKDSLKVSYFAGYYLVKLKK